MKINVDTAEGSGRVEIEVTEDGMVLISWLGVDGELFRWWKLSTKQADHLADIIKNCARHAANAASS